MFKKSLLMLSLVISTSVFSMDNNKKYTFKITYNENGTKTVTATEKPLGTNVQSQFGQSQGYPVAPTYSLQELNFVAQQHRANTAQNQCILN